MTTGTSTGGETPTGGEPSTEGDAPTTTPEGSTGEATGSGGETTEGGCGCRTRAQPTEALAWLLALVFVRRRRRVA